MFRPLAIFIGLRYTRAKRRSHVVSVITLISIISFALAVTALITVLSVMNGFEQVIRGRAFSMAQQVIISTQSHTLGNWQALAKDVDQEPDVIASSPFIEGQGMLTAFGQANAARIFGVLPEYAENISEVAAHMREGKLSDLHPGKFGIVLGQDLAATLGVMIGDKVTLVTPRVSVSPVGIVPRLKPFTVVGIFEMGTGFGYDKIYAYIHLQDAAKLYQMGDLVTGLELKLQDMYQAPQIAQLLRDRLRANFQVLSWTSQYQAIFEAVRLEKTMMFWLLLILIVLTSFSLLASLHMIVNDKSADIAILRTIGATPKMILRIFMVQGSLIGLIGTGVGLLAGVVLSLTITDLTNAVQDYFGIRLLSSNVYYVDYLPAKLMWSDVFWVCFAALAASVVATIIPAYLASKVQPAEALRYE